MGRAVHRVVTKRDGVGRHSDAGPERPRGARRHRAAGPAPPGRPRGVGRHRQLDAGLPPGPGDHQRRADVPLRTGTTRALPPRARPVRDLAAADRRPARQPLLHDLDAADTAPPAGHHREAPARRPRLELAARHDDPRHADLGRRTVRRLHDSPPPVGEVPLPVRRQRDHAGHGDDAEHVRPRLRRRRRVRAQRADPVRHHLPPRARDHREHGAHRARRPRVRAGRTSGALERPARLPEHRHAAGGGSRPGRARRVLLRARSLHGRCPPDARRSRLRSPSKTSR